MGVAPISALVSISCAASLDRFPLVARIWIHRESHQSKPFCSFLGLVAPVHAQDVQIRRAAHRVLSEELLLLEQYQIIILMLKKPLRPSDSLNKGRTPSKDFLRAADHLDYLDPLTTAQTNFILSFILTRLKSSAKL
jgi:hypothetical protein